MRFEVTIIKLKRNTFCVYIINDLSLNVPKVCYDPSETKPNIRLFITYNPFNFYDDIHMNHGSDVTATSSHSSEFEEDRRLKPEDCENVQ
ncbi:Uncharacterized protein FWK35_00000188 [Aphis craccivora]|uniref:Uncharacterized protein n=1 Tax=Aphis craccivora TaxID=307492 RepID=A0A6G0ZQ15_APHCR|nr:Uncharacterized protein FWK35_00000188 [Aphis craccivora]